MGCGSTKLAPDSPIVDKHIDWVKTVETGGVAYNPAKTTHYNRTNNGDNKSQKRARWKVKFDPRVNAKYDIKALIGTGTYSRVVRVEHRSTKQPYAIKMVEKKRDGKQFWEAELNILRRVRHANIIQLLEVYDGKDRVYMIMELATGGELFDRIVTRGHFTERDATCVLAMVLDALRYLHGLGITHRDLKPENLLYYHPGNESKIMITDFGLASYRKTVDAPENNMMRTICGTPEYIAPEILLRKPYNQTVDLWAIGVVAFILLSGRMPFDDDNRTRLYRKILRAKYSFTGEPWKDVSSAGKDFIDKLLVINPSERMTTVQALKHPWIITNAAQSSLKNLQQSISQNWLRHTSSRSRSSRSARSTRSNHSSKSSKSLRSNKGQRVKAKDLDRLAKEIKKETKSDDSKNANNAKTSSTERAPSKTSLPRQISVKSSASPQPLPDIAPGPSHSRRYHSEQTRQSGEQGKKSGDQVRQSGDKVRESGDQVRQSGDRVRGSGDRLRQSVDSVQPSGDGVRQSGDRVRESGDRKRQSGDQLRQSVDSVRQSADQAKQSGDRVRHSADHPLEKMTIGSNHPHAVNRPSALPPLNLQKPSPSPVAR